LMDGEQLLEFEHEVADLEYVPKKAAKKRVILKTRTGEEVEVDYLGEDYYGTHNGKEVWCPIYSFEAVKVLCAEIRYAQMHGWDQPILVTGREGAGKSSLIMHMIYQLDPHFDLNNIAWDLEDFFIRAKDAKPLDIIWMDEAGEAAYYADWMKKGQKELVKSFLRRRIKRLVYFIALPHRSLLNFQLRERRVFWWIDVFAVDWDDRGYAQVRKAPISQNRWSPQNYWRGYFTLRFPSFESLCPDIWRQYEEIKMRRVEELDARDAQEVMRRAKNQA